MADLLKPTEAAVVSGVELSIVHKAIDRALPPRLVRRGRGKGVSPEACFYIAFYHGSAGKLTSDERRSAILEIADRIEADDSGSLWASLRRHCKVHHEYLNLDLEPFVTGTHTRWGRYLAACSAVTSDPDVLGGTPVLSGTRIPVHDVAASVAAGLSETRIRSAYPALSTEQIELASLYAQANPLQGRPPERKLPSGAKVVSRRVIERRRKTA